MKSLFVPLLVISVLAVEAEEQEPRLPAPAQAASPDEALIQRARALYASQNYRESAAAWQTVATREPSIFSLTQRESVRALIAAGDVEAALSGLTEMGSSAPAELLLRAADACRSATAFDRAAALYRRAREAAGRTQAADEAALGLAATLEQNGQALEALGAYRELQLTFRQASAFDTADASARRLSTQLNGVEPLTEADFDAIVDRLVGVAAFRRAVDMQIEWLTRFPDSIRRLNVESAIVQNLYSLRANGEARDRASAFLRKYADSPANDAAHDVIITLFRLDVREGRTSDVEKRGRAILTGQVAGTTLADRQSAARLLAEYLVSVGQPANALGIYDQLYEMTKTRAGRMDVLWRMAIASLRAGNRPRAVKHLEEVLRLKPGSETERATSFWLGYAHDAAGSKAAAKKHWSSIVERDPFSYYGLRAAARIGALAACGLVRIPRTLSS